MGFHPNETVLSFQVPDVCAKFNQNRLKIATARARTDRHTDTHPIIIPAVHYVHLAVCVDDAQCRDVAPDAAAESVRSNCHSSDVITVQV